MGNILNNGIDYTSGTALFENINEVDFSNKILNSLNKQIKELQSYSDKSDALRSFRDVQKIMYDANKNNPQQVGWTYIINEKDPNKKELIETLKPLATLRGMLNPEEPLIYNGETIDKWNDWLMENLKRPGSKIPYYILIIGNPNLKKGIPFEFQSFLGIESAVGRLDFDSINDLKNYVTKVVRLEKLEDAVVNKEIISFAPDEGYPWSTHYSKLFLAEPLSNNKYFGYKVNKLYGNDATKTNLKKSLSRSKPAMIFTASNGFAAYKECLEVQKAVNGAICCQTYGNERSRDEYMFSGDDIPIDSNSSFLEGAVFVQFACCGAGTPSESIFNKWLNEKPKLYASESFTSSISKKLLSHPRGPIGFIGHVDVAFLHGFDNPETPDMHHIMPWDARIHPFTSMFKTILREYGRNGRSLYEMSKRLEFYSSIFAARAEKMALNELPLNNNQFRTMLTDDFIMRNDSINYILLGDPAGRISLG